MSQATSRGLGFVSLAAILAALTPVAALAQDRPAPVEPGVYVVQFTGAPASSPPRIEHTADGFDVFTIDVQGTFTGDLNGTYAWTASSVSPADASILLPISPVNLHLWTTQTFSLTTDAGTIQGYSRGIFYHPEEGYPNAMTKQFGQVLAVSGAYTQLNLADVFYDGTVKYVETDGVQAPVSDTGTMTIAVH